MDGHGKRGKGPRKANRKVSGSINASATAKDHKDQGPAAVAGGSAGKGDKKRVKRRSEGNGRPPRPKGPRVRTKKSWVFKRKNVIFFPFFFLKTPYYLKFLLTPAKPKATGDDAAAAEAEKEHAAEGEAEAAAAESDSEAEYDSDVDPSFVPPASHDPDLDYDEYSDGEVPEEEEKLLLSVGVEKMRCPNTEIRRFYIYIYTQPISLA